MYDDVTSAMRAVNALVDEHRASCLWFLKPDYYPTTTAEACRVLNAIEKHGSLDSFRKAAELRRWLLQNSNAPSAV